MGPGFYDAHNHLHDERFGGRQAELVAECRRVGIVRMVVNGACEGDWPAVLDWGLRHRDLILPSFGYHPWYVAERTPDWERVLTDHLDRIPSGIGEIGLDRWKAGLPYEGQEEVFLWQLRLAAERHRPASLHCLRAWGRMLELLRTHPVPRCGFLLHSYGGPREMVGPLAELGAYFSLPGYFAHERKARQREVFRAVPWERLLLETDAPDQSLPTSRARYGWVDPGTGRAINHPANLPAVYEFAAELLDRPLASLAAQVEENFWRLFSPTR